MKMKLKKEDEASFYKILLSDSEYLPLPPAFAKKYLEKGGNKKQTFVLKTESGVEWRVKYIRIEDRYYFMDGWLKFMNDNNIQFGDFLVFWLRSHHPNKIFEVFIYSPSGCLKNTTSSSHDPDLCNENKCSTEEDTNDGDSSESVQRLLSMARTVKKSYMYKMPLNRDFVKAAGINYGYLQLENEDGKIWDAILECGRNQTPVVGRGWSDFLKDNKLKVGNRCIFTRVQDNLLRVNKERRRPKGLKSKGG